MIISLLIGSHCSLIIPSEPNGNDTTYQRPKETIDVTPQRIPSMG